MLVFDFIYLFILNGLLVHFYSSSCLLVFFFFSFFYQIRDALYHTHYWIRLNKKLYTHIYFLKKSKNLKVCFNKFRTESRVFPGEDEREDEKMRRENVTTWCRCFSIKSLILRIYTIRCIRIINLHFYLFIF